MQTKFHFSFYFYFFLSQVTAWHAVHGYFFQDSELRRTVDESERIKRAYGHYFDLCIINDGLEAAFRSLRSALEKLSTEQQWVPVSWVFWEGDRGVRGQLNTRSSKKGCPHEYIVGVGPIRKRSASRRAFSFFLFFSSFVQTIVIISWAHVKLYLIGHNWNHFMDIYGEELRVEV